MVGGAAILPIMLVVRDEVAVHALPAGAAAVSQQLDRRVVERLDGIPGAMEKVQAAGVQLAAGGHTGHAAHVGIVKDHGALGKPGEVRSVHPRVAIARQIAAVERVEHHDGLHGRSPICSGAQRSVDRTAPARPATERPNDRSVPQWTDSTRTGVSPSRTYCSGGASLYRISRTIAAAILRSARHPAGDVPVRDRSPGQRRLRGITRPARWLVAPGPAAWDALVAKGMQGGLQNSANQRAAYAWASACTEGSLAAVAGARV